MEDRQRQIREGAGLEESRLNVEFIDMLRKYSTPILLVVAVIAGGYAGFHFIKRQRDEARDAAFVQLESAMGSRSFASLKSVADDNAGRASVPLIARLNAADLQLESYRSGLRPGIQLLQDPATNTFKLPEGENYLTDEERTAALAQAAALYTTVAEQTQSDPARVLLAIGAWSGSASVAECRGQLDEARTYYTKIIEAAKASGYDGLAASAQKRLDSLEQMKTAGRLYAMADLPKPPAPASNLLRATSPDGQTLTFTPDPTNPSAVVPTPDPNAPGSNGQAPPGGTPLPPPPAGDKPKP